MPHEIIPYTDEHLAAVSAIAEECLDLPEDAGETDHLLRRLLAPPEGRRVVRLVALSNAGQVSGVLFGSVRDADPATGHLDLVAVLPAARRQGIARSLVAAAEQILSGYGVRELRIAGNDPSYAWPGIDVRYTPAACLALALGFQQYTTGWNMTADLRAQHAAEVEDRLAEQDITVRRADAADVAALEKLARDEFGGGWAWEVAESIRRGEAGEVAGCHIALRGGELLGFAAFGALRPSLFGPMGTLPAARGTGIGTVLLRRCLDDQRAAGMATSQIGWAGPIAFYSRTIGARIERVFLLYRKKVAA